MSFYNVKWSTFDSVNKLKFIFLDLKFKITMFNMLNAASNGLILQLVVFKSISYLTTEVPLQFHDMHLLPQPHGLTSTSDVWLNPRVLRLQISTFYAQSQNYRPLFEKYCMDLNIKLVKETQKKYRNLGRSNPWVGQAVLELLIRTTFWLFWSAT